MKLLDIFDDVQILKEDHRSWTHEQRDCSTSWTDKSCERSRLRRLVLLLLHPLTFSIFVFLELLSADAFAPIQNSILRKIAPSAVGTYRLAALAPIVAVLALQRVRAEKLPTSTIYGLNLDFQIEFWVQAVLAPDILVPTQTLTKICARIQLSPRPLHMITVKSLRATGQTLLPLLPNLATLARVVAFRCDLSEEVGKIVKCRFYEFSPLNYS